MRAKIFLTGTRRLAIYMVAMQNLKCVCARSTQGNSFFVWLLLIRTLTNQLLERLNWNSRISASGSSIQDVQEQTLSLYFRYYSNVHFPRVIRLIKSVVVPQQNKLCRLGLQPNGDSLFAFDDTQDRYVPLQRLSFVNQHIFAQFIISLRAGFWDSRLDQDHSIYYGLSCNTDVDDVTAFPRIWYGRFLSQLELTPKISCSRYHAACLNAKLDVNLRRSGHIIHNCEFCTDQLHVTTLDESFHFVDVPWSGKKPKNSIYLFGTIDVIAGWQNFFMLELTCSFEFILCWLTRLQGIEHFL